VNAIDPQIDRAAQIKRRVRSNALLLTAVAVAFYVGFILLGVLKAGS
jgi:hypothetical protein